MLNQEAHDTADNKKYIKSVLDLFSIPNFYIRKGRLHGHRYGKKEGCKEYHTANQLQMKCRKKQYKNIHDRFIRDTWFRQTMLELGRTEEVILKMDRLANEDHTPHCHRRRNQRVSWQLVDTFEFCGFRHDAGKASSWLQESIVNLYRLKKAEDAAHYQNWSQSSSSSWWQWQGSWWHPSSETSPRRWTWHWSNVETWENQWIVYLLVAWVSQWIWCKITVIISVTVKAVHCHRRVV